MASDKKLEGILMPMPVAFKNDGAIDHAGRMRSSTSIWQPAFMGFSR